MLDNLAITSNKSGLTISCKKTKILAVLINPGAQSPAPIQLVPGGEPIEAVSHFQYLGSTVQYDCGMDAEVSFWICKDSSAPHPISRILWCQWKIQTSTKVRILNGDPLSSEHPGCLSQGEEAPYHHAQHGKAAEDIIYPLEASS